uniref:Ovochymase-2 n=1 Tax=Pyxicephalus adspersus TaxID=30357 RepID=A0AAV3A1I0_PYXAD|nr:TPA: hypothetical protein GDO54_002887 [Pyxicephalus adspersus]
MIFAILKVIVHEEFNPMKPINHDIAVLVLVRNIIFGAEIQPVCLPSPDENFPSGSLCVALGWGRIEESGPTSNSLQQVTLPIVDHDVCMRAMETLGPSATFRTAVCAGFPEGGKDACQGDSGGPFLCPRSHGSWVLVGVTSWGMGCARSWSNNMMLPLDKKGSPGIFTDVKKMLKWLYAKLDQAESSILSPTASCSPKNQILTGTTGTLKLPKYPTRYYLNNEECAWTIYVPEGKHILLTFRHFDLEFDNFCDLDYLAVYTEKGSLIGKFCGSDRPRPLLITNNKVKLKFISDFKIYRTGFSLFYEAVEPQTYPDSECGSVAVISGEGEIQTMNHPEKYRNNANCKWIIICPSSFRIKITFQVFEVEPSIGCVFDYVLIYTDLVGINVAGRFCGFYIPDPIESTSNVMQIVFSSDSQTGCKAAPILPMFINQSITIAEEAIPNSWPWHVSIKYVRKHICSGVIVSETFVLTSASCIVQTGQFRDLLLVVAGLHDLERSEDAQIGSVKEIHVHPNFVLLTMENDIALIELKEEFQFNDYVQPVCFPLSDIIVEPSSICVVSGWDLNGEGETSTKLQQQEVPIETDGVCESYYGTISESMVCAGVAKGQDTCLVSI